MRLQIIWGIDDACISSEKGFLIPEMMLAFSLMTVFLVSAIILSSTMRSLRNQAIQHLEKLGGATRAMDLYLKEKTLASTTFYSMKQYGNDSYEMKIDPLTVLISNYSNAWGKDSCKARLNIDPTKLQLYSVGVNLGPGNASTDIEVRNSIAYLTADSAIAASPDLYIIDLHDPTAPILMSSLNTGPGLSTIEVAGHYIYTANLSTTNQLQIFDISDRTKPTLLTKFKLPLPDASSTAPLATSIFYRNGLVYLGTEKWQGDEFSIIDVKNPLNPIYLGGFKTDTLVNDIYVQDNLAYLATSDIGQMRILDINDPSNIKLVETFSPSGWETQEGKSLSFFEGKLMLGRTTGGFNNKNNPELFIFSTTTPLQTDKTRDVPGGVYDLVFRPPFIYLSTILSGSEFQILSSDLTSQIYSRSLGFLPSAMACDNNDFYFATGDQRGVAVLKQI